MNALDDAWHWYTATRTLLRAMRRLASRHWNDLPWEGTGLGTDNLLRELEAPPLVSDADFCLEQLDDLAVVALFSAFESLVRQKVAAEVDRELPSIRHPVLIYAAEEAARELKQGEFLQGPQFAESHRSRTR